MEVIAKTTARVSLKDSIVLCKIIRNKRAERVKKLLQNLLDKKESINGKYYTKTTEKILELLEVAIANAKQKNMDEKKLFIKMAKADKGPTIVLPKSRAKFRGRKAKSTNLTIVLVEK